MSEKPLFRARVYWDETSGNWRVTLTIRDAFFGERSGFRNHPAALRWALWRIGLEDSPVRG